MRRSLSPCHSEQLCGVESRGTTATPRSLMSLRIRTLQVCPLPSLRRKGVTWPVKKRHPQQKICQHVLIAEQKWSLSLSHQSCSSVNSRNSRSHVRSAVLPKYSRSNAADSPISLPAQFLNCSRLSTFAQNRRVSAPRLSNPGIAVAPGRYGRHPYSARVRAVGTTTRRKT